MVHPENVGARSRLRDLAAGLLGGAILTYLVLQGPVLFSPPRTFDECVVASMRWKASALLPYVARTCRRAFPLKDASESPASSLKPVTDQDILNRLNSEQ